jgi:hypothetical protein
MKYSIGAPLHRSYFSLPSFPSVILFAHSLRAGYSTSFLRSGFFEQDLLLFHSFFTFASLIQESFILLLPQQ